MRKTLSLAFALLCPLTPVSAGELAVPATVVSVYDGDTFTVEARPWPGMTLRTSVRVRGVDTPEIRGKCQAEKDLAGFRCRPAGRGGDAAPGRAWQVCRACRGHG